MRLASRLASPAAIAALATTAALAVSATPASALPNNPCATARAEFRAAMNQARFWIGAADQLAAAGDMTGANQANDEANYYLGQAENALGTMTDVC
jgi:hypothetical protein